LYYRLYQILCWLVFAAVFPFFLVYCILSGKHQIGLAQRLGFLKKLDIPDNSSERIWLHAASVGEVQAARALISELQKHFPHAAFILSTFTEQGQRVARKQLGPDVLCIYAPLDLTLFVNRALEAIRPILYICLETEIWPAILKQADKKGVKLVLLNGRLSKRSFKKYSKIQRFIQETLTLFSMISVIQKQDAERYISLGAPRDKIGINGNAKYDLSTTDHASTIRNRYQKWLHIKKNQPVLLLGSTHTDEEKLLLRETRKLKSELEDLLLIIAPRHLNRLPEVAALFETHAISFDRFSHTKQHGRKTDVILVDTMGDLAGLYSIATYIFCGGSLVPRGGHNVMEAAAWGKPVFYGPSMKDFADAAELLESAEAGFPIAKPEALTRKILFFAEHPGKYQKAAQMAAYTAAEQRGSAKKQAKLVRDILFAN
jgi:3-deoxy-D-manno-octulosonic-acid transferase